MPSNPRVVMMSIWRNDADRSIYERMRHLTYKSYHNLRWVWVVGDSDDETEDILRAQASTWQRLSEADIEVIRHDTGILGDDPKSRVRRIALTENAGFDRVRPDDDLWMIHESDLVSPLTVVEQFAANLTPERKEVIAGWVTLGDTDKFYDSWAYRCDGRRFSNYPPYHNCYKPNKPFEVDSAGSVLMFPAQALRDGVRAYEVTKIELCEELRQWGCKIIVDPTIKIIQPVSLWIPRSHAT